MRIQNRCKLLVVLLVAFCQSQILLAKEHIEVSAFYVHPSDLLQLETTPKDYSPNCVQVRVIHTFDKEVSMADYHFPKIGSGLAEMASDMLIFANMRINNGNGWTTVSCQDFGKEENRSRTFRQIAYSYSPGNDFAIGSSGLTNNNHVAAAMYTQSDKGNWYVVPKDKIKSDMLDIYFNIDPSLFYLRTSKPAQKDDMGRFQLTVQPQDDFVDFYLFYLPSYKHLSKKVGTQGHTFDFLFENVNDSLCVMDEKKIDLRYYPTDSVAKERFDNAVNTLNQVAEHIGWNHIPKDIRVVLSSQVINMTCGDSQQKVVFSFAKTDSLSNYGLLLIDHSMFYGKTFIHELLHTCLPDKKYGIDTMNSNFFKESVVEYIASCIYQDMKKTADVFGEHQKVVNKYFKSRRQLKDMLSREKCVSVSSNETLNTFWIFYDYFPLRMHDYAKAHGGDMKLQKSIIDYLTLTNPVGYTFSSLLSFLKSRGYKGMEKIWTL